MLSRLKPFHTHVFSAPMAGYTDPPYRRLLESFCDVVLFTEMIDSHALVQTNDKTIRMLGDRGPLLHTQIAAGTVVLAERAVKTLLEHDTFAVNLNMGCPAKKVVSCGGGSNLLRHPQIIQQVCQKVRELAGDRPFSVKFRSGWNSDTINYPEIAKIFEGEGVDFIMLHARTRAEAFSGHSHWDHIAHLKTVVKIPVIGNGDIVSYESARQMALETNCDGIAIGRGATGNPWLYRQAHEAFLGRPPLPEPTLQERASVMQKHYALIREHYDLRLSSHMIRKHLVGYLRGLPGHKAVKEKMFSLDALTLDQFCNIVGEFFEGLETGRWIESSHLEESSPIRAIV